MKRVENLITRLNRIPRNAIFPLLLVMTVLTLSFLNLSGTSMGVYDYMFGTPPVDDLIAGQPRTVRSDEWTVNTPFTIEQSVKNYPSFSENIGSGQDMSLIIDVPYRDWSILFKPQNLIFFIAPLGFAFSFKWWLLAGMLMLSVYVFVLYFYPKRYLMASLLATLFIFNPFIQWWYQTITILPIAYGLLIFVLAMKVLNIKNFIHKLSYSLLMIYLLICFTLLMYPAFQISVVLVLATIFISMLAAKKELGLLMQKRNTPYILLIPAVSVIVVGLFVFQHFDALMATLNTVYPGERHIESGGLNPTTLITWPLSYLLLSSETANVFNNNQSEVSNFLLIGFITTPVLLLLWKQSKRQILNRWEFVLLAASSIAVLFIFWRMFIPFGDSLFSLVGLSKVPHPRLFIALGMINLVFLMVAIGRKGKPLQSYRKIIDKYHVIVLCTTTVVFSLIILYLKYHFVLTTVGWIEVVATVLALSIPTTLLLSPFIQPRYIGLSIMCVFAAASTSLANPLYIGLSLDDNPLVQYVKDQESKDDKYWISNDQPYLSSAILASGAELYGGVNAYPQAALWARYFPQEKGVYNRYAHVRFKIDPTAQTPYLSLLQADSFRVTLSSCDPLLKELRIGYIVSDIELGEQLPCYPNRLSRDFKNKPLYIYSN